MATYPKRGEIWLGVHPDEEFERPCLIVSTNSRNLNSNSVIVVPITSNLTPSPTHVELDIGDGGLSQKSMVRCENIATIYKEFLGDDALGRALSQNKMSEIERAILRAVGIVNLS